jgi:hypothetical protein
MEALRALADEKNIRDVRKLYQFARGWGEEVTMKQAAEALRTSTQRELLAPPAKALGHFAATRPGDQIQADLIDWGALNKKAKKGGGQYAIVASDIYTRRVEAEAIPNKKASTVDRYFADILSKLDPTDKDTSVVTTDKGQEWADISKDADHIIHRTKDTRDANGLAVVDSAIRNVKRDLAAEVGKERGRTWGGSLEKVVHDLNQKPNDSVFGPPDRVTENKLQEFRVMQEQAANFALNDRNRQRQANDVMDAGAFRAPVGDGRAANATYGPAQKYEGHDSQYVWSKGHLAALKRGESGEEYEHLLKQVKPAYGNGKFLSTLTTDVGNRKINAKAQTLLKNQALQLENEIRKSGPVPVDSLLKRISGLRALTQKYRNLTSDNWITQSFKKKFVIENGQVKLRPPRAAAAAPPEAVVPLGGPKMLRGVKSAPAAALVAPAPFKLVKGGGRKAVEMLRQASAPVAPAPPAPAAPTAPAAKPKKDKNFFLGLSAMYPGR